MAISSVKRINFATVLNINLKKSYHHPPESFFEFLLGGLVVGVLFQKVRGDVEEAVEVHLTGTVGVIFRDQVVQFHLVEQLAHGVEDGGDLDGLDETGLGGVEHLEGFADDRQFLLVVTLPGQKNNIRKVI